MQNYKEDILKQTTEADIFRHYVPGFKGQPGSFINPLKPDEKHPSLSLYQHEDGKGLRFDAKNTGHQGDAFQLVADLKNIDSKKDFTAVCEAIAQDMNLALPEPAATVEKIWEAKVFPEIQDDGKRYFSQWGITPEVLSRYGVEQVARLINGEKDFDYKKLGWPAFRYKAGKREKIRLPHKVNGWVQNSAKEPYLFGYAQVPEEAEALILCEGEKDVLALAAKGFSAVTVGSATDKVTPAHLERIRAKNCPVFICYDTDAPGRKAAAEIAGKTGFPVIELPEIPGGKDISDYYAAGHTAAEFSALMESAENRAGEKKKSGVSGPVAHGAAANGRPVQPETGKKAQDDKTPEGSAKGAATAYQVAQLYEILTDRNGKPAGIKPKANKLLELLQRWGYARYDTATAPQLIHRKDNVIRPVSGIEIADAFFSWLKTAPAQIGDFPLEKILNKFLDGQDTYFSEKRLYRLEAAPVEFCRDSRKETFFYFENGFVRCTEKTWSLHRYSEMKGCIWESQIIGRKREGNHVTPGRKVNVLAPPAEPYRQGIVAQFLYNVCGQDSKRFIELATLLGYLMHDYFEGNLFAVLLTDSSLENGDNGRTGKSLIAKLLAAMKPAANIDAKGFRAENKFMFQEVPRNAQFVVLNDLPKRWDLEPLFNAITEGITVEKKNQEPFTIPAKILLTTNSPIRVEGASARARIREAELSDHYSDRHTVADDFPGKYFLSQNEEQFSAQDWDEYFNLIFYCCNAYLQFGVLEPEQINLNRRKLIAQTPEGFPDWVEYQIEQGKIKNGDWKNPNDLHHEFLEAYPEHKQSRKWSTPKFFRQALIDFKNLSEHFTPHDKDNQKKKNNGVRPILFLIKEKAD